MPAHHSNQASHAFHFLLLSFKFQLLILAQHLQLLKIARPEKARRLLIVPFKNKLFKNPRRSSFNSAPSVRWCRPEVEE